MTEVEHADHCPISGSLTTRRMNYRRWRCLAWDDRGRTIAQYGTSQKMTGSAALVHVGARYPFAARVAVEPIPTEEEKAAPCPRCGASQSSCGGPSNPHD